MIIKLGGKNQASNSYLILTEQPALIDTGLGDTRLDDFGPGDTRLDDFGPGGDIAEEVSRRIPLKSLKYIINTHAHFDHIGGNKLFPKAEILMHNSAARAVIASDEKVILNTLFGGKICSRVDRQLMNGERINLGDNTLRVIHTPGHTAGSISLLLENEGALFSGDTLFSHAIGRTDLPTGDADKMTASLRKILSLDYSKGYPGHGESFTKSEANAYILELLG